MRAKRGRKAIYWLIPQKYNKKNQNYKTEKQTKVKDLIENRTQFTKIEKKIIEYIFSFQQIRELACRYDNLKEGILNILERMFLFKVTLEHETRGTDFIKGFLVNNKNFLENFLQLRRALY